MSLRCPVCSLSPTGQVAHAESRSCATALSHPQYGATLFKTSVSIAGSLSKLVMVLNKRPDLTRRLRVAADDEERKSIVESTADIIQKIFTSCLTDRSGGRLDRPQGKKAGVYILANLVLKLLLTVRGFPSPWCGVVWCGGWE